MCHLNPFLNISFFNPNRIVYRGPEALPTSAGEDRADIGEAIRILDESPDAEILRDSLTGWIDGHYPDLRDRLHAASMGALLEAVVELRGVDVNQPPTQIVQDIFDRTFQYQYPNGYNSSVQEVIDRAMTIIRSPRAYRPDAQERGAEILSEVEARLTSPRLEELRTELIHMEAQYDKYVSVANKAVINLIKREVILKKLMEAQGFQYDRSGESENFYHFTSDYSLVWDGEASEMTQDAIDTVNDATDTWRNFGQHYERSNQQVEHYETQVKKVEAQIRSEEEKVKNS